jgi:hypothetical protein
MRWEYRVHTTKLPEDDREASQKLTNVGGPATHEPADHGWEIFHVQPAEDGGVRLHMKRPKQG